MIKRSLAIWRSTDPLLTIVLMTAITTIFLGSRGLPWRGEWAWTLDWAAGSTILSAPIASGLAAFESARWRPVTSHLLLPTTRRRLAANFFPAVAVWATSASVYLVGTMVALLISLGLHPTDNFQPQIVPLALLKLASGVLLGWVVGSRLRAVVAAVVAVVLSYGLILVASGDGAFLFYRVGGSTGSLAGQDFNSRFMAGAALLFAAMCMLLVAIHLGRSVLTRQKAYVSFGLALTLSVAGLALSSAPGSSAYHVASRQGRICRGQPVQICLLVGNTTQISRWGSDMNLAARGLKGVAFPFPARYEEPSQGGERSAAVGEVFFDPQQINIGPPSRVYLVESLSTPATCPAFASDEPPVEALGARYWLSLWMFHRLWPTDDSYRDLNVTNWEERTSSERQEAWARSTFVGLKACSLTDVRAPVAP